MRIWEGVILGESVVIPEWHMIALLQAIPTSGKILTHVNVTSA